MFPGPKTWSVHDEIGTYHFHDVREGTEDAAASYDDFTESFDGRRCRPHPTSLLRALNAHSYDTNRP